MKSGFIVIGGVALAAIAMALSGCTSSQVAKVETQVQIACNVDGVAQPIAAATLATLVPAATPAVALDNGVIHPAIVAFCAKQGGIAQALTVQAAPLPTAPAPSPAPAAAPVATAPAVTK